MSKDLTVHIKYLSQDNMTPSWHTLSIGEDKKILDLKKKILEDAKLSVELDEKLTNFRLFPKEKVGYGEAVGDENPIKSQGIITDDRMVFQVAQALKNDPEGETFDSIRKGLDASRPGVGGGRRYKRKVKKTKKRNKKKKGKSKGRKSKRSKRSKRSKCR